MTSQPMQTHCIRSVRPYSHGIWLKHFILLGNRLASAPPSQKKSPSTNKNKNTTLLLGKWPSVRPYIPGRYSDVPLMIETTLFLLSLDGFWSNKHNYPTVLANQLQHITSQQIPFDLRRKSLPRWCRRLLLTTMKA